jgi:hypothetical protein
MVPQIFDSIMTGWWYTYPSEKYESRLGLLFPTEWKKEMFQTTNQMKLHLYFFKKNMPFKLQFPGKFHDSNHHGFNLQSCN